MCRETYLSNSQTGQGDTGTGTWRLVHLTENECDLGVALEVNDTSLLHFVVQIVTLTGTLTNTGEDGETSVGLCDVVLWQCVRESPVSFQDIRVILTMSS